MPEGAHKYQFRYLPWDVPVGLLMTLTGIFLAIRYYRKDRFPYRPGGRPQDQENQASPIFSFQ